MLRGCLWRDATDFGCSDPLKVRPLFLRSVADAADLAAPVSLDSNDLAGRILVPVGTLMVVSFLADGPLRSRGCRGAVRTG